MIKPIGVEDKPLDWFKLDPKELARHSDPEKIRQLGENMLARGQLQDGAATEDGRIIFCHGRFLGAKAVGMKTLRVKIYPNSLSDTEFRLIRAAENLQRNELTGDQKFLLCSELMASNPTWQQQDLAAALNLTAGQITRLLSPARCSPAWQAALQAGQVGIGDCYAASRVSPEEQEALLAFKLNGGEGGKKVSRDDLERAGKRKRNGQAQAAKVSRIKCPLPSGVTVQISGEGIDLDLALQAAQEWVKEVRRAIDQGLDAKTFERVCKDKSKKG